jgi:hypothetical protein
MSLISAASFGRIARLEAIRSSASVGVRGGGGDGGVAGQLLVRPKGAKRQPGDRIEPVEAEDEEAEKVPPDVAAAVMDAFMIEREALLGGRIAAGEIGGHDDPAIEEAESDRSLHGRAFDQCDAAMGAEAARIAAELGQEATIGAPLPDQEEGHADGPDREGDGHPERGSAVGRQGRGRIADPDDERLGRNRRGDVGRERRQRRHGQAKRRQQPQRIGRAGPEHPRERPADRQDEQHEKARPGHVGEQPAHCFSAFRSASISAMSAAVRRSRSARWATSGVTRPPNMRSSSRTDSCAT